MKGAMSTKHIVKYKTMLMFISISFVSDKYHMTKCRLLTVNKVREKYNR